MSQKNETAHVFLHPGEYAVANAECTMHTLLGSCVSVVLWHPGRRIGAMSHAILPSRFDKRQYPMSGRYADEVLALMMLDLEQMAIDPCECFASIYGGSSILLPVADCPQISGIGKRNAEICRRQLDDQGIPVIAESLFGNGYRTLMFDVATGHVRCRTVGDEQEAEHDMSSRINPYCS